jgi:hypothetical protein
MASAVGWEAQLRRMRICRVFLNVGVGILLFASTNKGEKCWSWNFIICQYQQRREINNIKWCSFFLSHVFQYNAAIFKN